MIVTGPDLSSHLLFPLDGLLLFYRMVYPQLEYLAVPTCQSVHLISTMRGETTRLKETTPILADVCLLQVEVEGAISYH